MEKPRTSHAPRIALAASVAALLAGGAGCLKDTTTPSEEVSALMTFAADRIHQSCPDAVIATDGLKYNVDHEDYKDGLGQKSLLTYVSAPVRNMTNDSSVRLCVETLLDQLDSDGKIPDNCTVEFVDGRKVEREGAATRLVDDSVVKTICETKI